MANKKVTDLTAITTAPVSGVIHFIDTTDTSQNAAGSSFKVTKADLLKENTAAILLNTAKVGITPAQATAITNNTNKVGYTDALVAAAPSVVLNTAKVGITPSQTSAITANTSKVGYTDALVAAAPTVIANTAKVGISSTQATAITNNTAKVGYTEALVNANTSVVANTAKVGYTDALVAAAPSVVANTAKVGITTVQATAITDNTANTSKVSINNDAASLANVRSLRYREETYSSNLDMVMQSSVGVYAWVNVFTLAFNVVNSLVTRFKNRVATDGGTFQNQTQLETFLGTITSTLSTVLAAITPNAFKAGKLYGVIGNTSATDMTVVRNTPASTVNSAGLLVFVAANIPRFRHLTVGGDALIQDEPQATNLILQSNTFTNSLWAKNDTVILSTNNLSPDGTLNATRIGCSATANATLQQVITTTSGQPFSTSFWVRRVSGSANVFLRAGSLGSTTITLSSVWQRFSFSGSSDSTTARCAIGLVSPVVGTDVIEVYYSQFENTSFATSTIPATTTAAVTRNADFITMTPPTGTVKITTTFSDNSTQVLTTIPATYTMPEGLIKSVNFNNTL